MTTGQRIAALRRQQNLSQEALGERLGVTRQSISKWESDGALPEVEKLVAMSRLFHISVGALLGVEEPAGETEETELTDAQLKMVEEIAARYMTAQPSPAPSASAPPVSRRRRTVVKIAAASGTLCLALVLLHLSGQLSRLENQYQNLNRSVIYIQDSVNQQINSITSRVEAALEAQNSLFLNRRVTLTQVDVAAGSASFRVEVQPKSWTEDTAVIFLAEAISGSSADMWEPVQAVARQEPGLWYAADLICPLDGGIRFSAILEAGGVRATQSLDTWHPSGVSPDLRVDPLATLRYTDAEPDVPFPIRSFTATVTVENADGSLPYVGEVPCIDGTQVRAGLFRNDDLILWAEPTDEPQLGPDAAATPEDPTQMSTWYFQFPETEITLGDGDLLWIAATGVDNYGREVVAADVPYAISNGELTWARGDLVFQGKLLYQVVGN